jgi:hypothetical protein
MKARILTVPKLLDELVAAGRWPRDSKESLEQNLKCLAPMERILALAPEQDWLYLLPPPFYTVRQKSENNPGWILESSAPQGIDFDLALVIGYFGSASDSPILLDYREDLANPRVVRLRWAGEYGKDNEWVVITPDFATFVSALGL